MADDIESTLKEVRVGTGGNTPANLSLTQAFNAVAPETPDQKHPDSKVQLIVPPVDHRAAMPAAASARQPA